MFGIGDAVALAARSAQAMVSLPDTLLTVNRTAHAVAESVESGQATIATAQRLSERLEALADDLEKPLRQLVPGLRRTAAVLDDPIIGQLPDILRRIQADLLPVVRGMQDTQERIATIAASTERITLLVDQAGARITTLPGSLLRWPFRGEASGEGRAPNAPPEPRRDEPGGQSPTS